MLLLHLLFQDWLNTCKEGKKALNLPGQAVVESIFVMFKFSKIKMQRQNHNSAHKVCLNIIIIHYILSNFN